MKGCINDYNVLNSVWLTFLVKNIPYRLTLRHMRCEFLFIVAEVKGCSFSYFNSFASAIFYVFSS